MAGAWDVPATAVVVCLLRVAVAGVLPTPDGVVQSLLTDTCPQCMSVGDPKLATQLKLEAIKRQILSKLSLQEKPNITIPIPRDVVLEALRRTHSPLPPDPELQDSAHHPEREERDDYYARTSEIIAFAEPGRSVNGHTLLDFSHPQDKPRRLRVTAATLWVQLRYASTLPRSLQHLLRDHSVTLYVFRVLDPPNNGTLVGDNDAMNLELLLSMKVAAAHDGWKRLDLRNAVQQWFTEPTSGKLTLLVDCVGCDSFLELVLFRDVGGIEHALPRKMRHNFRFWGLSYRPFLAVATEPANRRRMRRYAVTCDVHTTQCCRQTLYVSFRELGWDDWIIAPKGYYANYCMGDCARMPRTPDTFRHFHSHVIEEYRNRNPYASITPCCAPTKLSPMSLIYFDPDLNIIKTDLPKMIVDECGCT